MTETAQVGQREGRGRPLVAVVGNIAAGKSTLATRLADELGWQYAAESVDQNPYLEGFYANPQTWAFHLNMYFLGVRAQQVLGSAGVGTGIVLDRSIYEDRIFVGLNVEDGVTTPDEAAVFENLAGALEQLLPRPSLLLHVQAPLRTLMTRIERRGRTFEAGLTITQLARLQSGYEGWLHTWDWCPILDVDTSEFDPRVDVAWLSDLAERVSSASW